MESSPTSDGLVTALERIKAIDEQIAGINNDLKTLKKQRDHLEKVALESLSDSRLAGVKAAGRSWRIEQEHSISLNKDNRQAAIEAAEKLGIADDMVTVMTSSLKAWLRDNAADAPKDRPWAEGTPFDGLVSEYVRPVLRHMTTG